MSFRKFGTGDGQIIGEDKQTIEQMREAVQTGADDPEERPDEEPHTDEGREG